MQEREWERGRKGMENKRRRQGGRVGKEEREGTEERGGTHDLLTNVRIRPGTQRREQQTEKAPCLQSDQMIHLHKSSRLNKIRAKCQRAHQANRHTGNASSALTYL